jgi:G:T-mismatch repair DNA endonuclease (very short patch repair protein)
MVKMNKKKVNREKAKRLREKLSDSYAYKPKRTRKHKQRTEPEKLTQELLDEMGVDYEIEKSLKYKFSWKHYDIGLIDYPILIEVDGNYWHGEEETRKKQGRANFTQYKNKQNDAIKNWLAKKNGYKLIRIWEKEIKEDRGSVKNKILDTINTLITENNSE